MFRRYQLTVTVWDGYHGLGKERRCAELILMCGGVTGVASSDGEIAREDFRGSSDNDVNWRGEKD